MIARQYNRKIKIYGAGTFDDGFGGNISFGEFIGSFWAEVKQSSSFKDNSLGKGDIKKTYSFKIRANSSLDIYTDNLVIEYNGASYTVNDISYADELRREINIIANG